MKYEAVIGIETHVQLKTKSKLFCCCDNNARDAAPNTLVCPVCLGLPGTLPVLNGRAVELAIRAGLALNGKIAERSKFDRKNYFYPDLPKGYQITQFDQPIVGNGYVEFPHDGSTVKIGITRAHLEEDAGKLTHPTGADYSLVDLNRAGTPLLEIVSEPDMRTPAQAKAYATEIYNLMRYADVSDADLYYGNMRFDVNISVRPIGSRQLGTRAEIKNLNSFRMVERASLCEFDRQVEILATGGKVQQETRGWDDAKGITYSQRSKEEAHDYRYFPEPDLPPLVINEAMIKDAGKDLSTPNQVRNQLSETPNAEVLVAEPDLAELLLSLPAKHRSRAANWLSGIILAERAAGRSAQLLPAEAWVELSEMVEAGHLSSTAAKQILLESAASGQSPKLVAERLNLLQVSDESELEKLVDFVLNNHQNIVSDYKAGKTAALGALVGQVMKQSGGQANPAMVNAILKKKLGA